MAEDRPAELESVDPLNPFASPQAGPEVATEGDSVEERDRQWLANVYRGDKEKDLTVRAVLAGMIFGGLMSLSNLYVGLRMGWGLGVDIAAVIVIFAVFKGLRAVGIVRREFGIMENTMMMTVAVAASWISSAGLVSAIPALSMLNPEYHFVWWQLTLFIAVILYLGLFMAIPLKRQMIQVEALRFPGNIPTGETLLVMYSEGGQAIKKAMALVVAGVVGAVVNLLRDGLKWIPAHIAPAWRVGGVPLGKLTLTFEPSMIFLGIGALFGMKMGLSMLLGVLLNYGILAPYLIDAKIIEHPAPKLIAAVPARLPPAMPAGQTLTVKLEEAVGGPELASGVEARTLRYTWTRPTKYSSLAGVVEDLNAKTLQDGSPNPFHDVLAASLESKDVHGEEVKWLVIGAPAAVTWESKLSLPSDQRGGILDALGFNLGEGASESELEEAKAKEKKATAEVGGYPSIVQWSLWPGATVLVVGGLLALAFQWRMLGQTFAGIFSALGGKRHAAKGVLDHIEIPMTWFVCGFFFFGSLAVLLLHWFFSIHWWMGLIAVLLTFFLAAVVARAGAETGINPIGAMGKVTQLTYGALAPGNTITNLMTADVTAGAACSCGDTIGNLKVGHMVGANPRRQFISQMFGVVAGALLAVPAYFILVPDARALGGDKFPAPSAQVWKGVAEVLSKGFATLPRSALWAAGVAFVLGVIIVVVDNVFPKAKPYTPSPAALGIALTVPASQGLGMFLGALIVWIVQKKAARLNDMYTVPVASGAIAGESIMGVVVAALQTLHLM